MHFFPPQTNLQLDKFSLTFFAILNFNKKKQAQPTPCQQEELSPCRRIMSLLDNHHRSNVKNMRSLRINEEDEDDFHQQSQFDDFDDDIGGSSGGEHEIHESMEEHHSEEEYSTSNGNNNIQFGSICKLACSKKSYVGSGF